MNEGTLQAKYFSYQGRLNRKRYIFRSLKLVLANFLFAFVTGTILVFFEMVSADEEGLENLITILSWPFAISGAMLTIRRWHDMNHSGWWYLLSFIPIINLVAVFMLLCKKGTYGLNDFGEDPLMYE